MYLYDKSFPIPAYPFLLVVCSVCVIFSFCDDHQFIEVSKGENSSWSTGRWWFRCL